MHSECISLEMKDGDWTFIRIHKTSNIDHHIFKDGVQEVKLTNLILCQRDEKSKNFLLA